MFAIFLTAFLACGSETKETTTTENRILKVETKDGKTIKSEFVDSKPDLKTTSENKANSNNLNSQKTDVKEFVEKSVNTSENK